MDNSQLVSEITGQIESLRDSICWAHDNINECQTNIVHLEESKVSHHSAVGILLNASSDRHIIEVVAVVR